MAQSDLNVQNADGATVRADINSQLEALATQNSGSTPPPVTFPFMRWPDTANQQLKERNAANTAWRVVADIVDGELVPYSEGSPITAWDGLKWLSHPIGVPFGIRDDLVGADVPPTDNASYRYIKLTASDAYNTGALTSESVSGSAPLVVATAVIDYAESPINGASVNLWNTEGRYGKPGTSPGTVANDKTQQITGSITADNNEGFGLATSGGVIPSGALNYSQNNTSTFNSSGSPGRNSVDILFDSANSPGARAGDHTDVKNQQLTYYMRIA